jgi:protein-L-isoaspartate O-methyltransferase
MLFLTAIIIDVAAIVAVLFIIFVLLLPIVLGAPYVPAKHTRVTTMVELAGVKLGERAVDLGSGDGRIVIALARAGAEAHGYEINPLLVWKSRRNIRAAGLSNRAFIHWKSFRQANFSSFDIVTIYGLKSIMRELEKRLEQKLPNGARVVSHTFQFPNWQPVLRRDWIYLYKV